MGAWDGFARLRLLPRGCCSVLGGGEARLGSVRGLAGCPAARLCLRRRCKLLNRADGVGEAREPVRSIASISKSLPFLAGEAPLTVKSLQQMKQNKEEFNA